VLVEKQSEERKEIRDAFQPISLDKTRFDQDRFGHNAFYQNFAFRPLK
jgi:hypothetical protein